MQKTDIFSVDIAELRRRTVQSVIFGINCKEIFLYYFARL